MKDATSSLLTEVCDEFIFYEDITRGPGIPDFSSKVPKDKQDCYQLLFETIDALQRESDAFILASRLKDTMKRKRPQFSESSYGLRVSFVHGASARGVQARLHRDPPGPQERHRRGRRVLRVGRERRSWQRWKNLTATR